MFILYSRYPIIEICKCLLKALFETKQSVYVEMKYINFSRFKTGIIYQKLSGQYAKFPAFLIISLNINLLYANVAKGYDGG